LNCPCIALCSLRSDCSCLLIGVPFLRWKSISSLDEHVVANKVEESSVWKLRDNVEWSIDLETPVLVQLTLLQFWWHFISVNDLEVLVHCSTLRLSDNNILVFSIESLVNFHYFSFFIDKFAISEVEKLEPSCRSSSHEKVVGTSIAFDVDRSVFPLGRLNGVGVGI